jgi:hypothetical protein
MPASLPDPEALALALQRHRVLGQLDAAAREALLAKLQPRRFAARETVAGAGALAQRLGIVARGSVGFRDEAGEAALNVKSPDWFGAGVQPAAVLAGCAAVAETSALVGFLPAEELAGLIEAHPALQLFMEPPAAAQSTPGEAALNVKSPDWFGAGVQPAAVLAGSALWWLLLCAAVGVMRGRFDAAWQRRVARVSALMLAAFALWQWGSLLAQ